MNKIILGDFMTHEDLEGVYDVAIVDPPYNIGKDFGNDTDKMDDEEYFEWCGVMIEKVYKLLKPGGSMFVYGFSETLAQIFVNIPYKSKKWLVWHYTNKTVPSLKDWQRTHESIIHLWKGDKIFNLDDVREEYTETFLKQSVGKKRKGTKGRFGETETVYTAHEKGALPRDVIKIPSLAGGAGGRERWFYCKDCCDSFHPKEKKNHNKHEIITHPTQKPMKLTEKLIRSSYNGGKVLIPFGGSGSECVVCKTMGIDFVSYELNYNYVLLGNCWLNKS